MDNTAYYWIIFGGVILYLGLKILGFILRKRRGKLRGLEEELAMKRAADDLDLAQQGNIVARERLASDWYVTDNYSWQTCDLIRKLRRENDYDQVTRAYEENFSNKVYEEQRTDLSGQIDDLGRKFLQSLALNQLTAAISCIQHILRIYQTEVPGDLMEGVLEISSWNPHYMQLLLQRCVTDQYRQLLQTAPTSAEDFFELRRLIEATRSRAIIDTEVVSALPYPKGWRSWEKAHLRVLVQ